MPGASGPHCIVAKGLQDQHLLELFLRKNMMHPFQPIVPKGGCEVRSLRGSTSSRLPVGGGPSQAAKARSFWEVRCFLARPWGRVGALSGGDGSGAGTLLSPHFKGGKAEAQSGADKWEARIARPWTCQLWKAWASWLVLGLLTPSCPRVPPGIRPACQFDGQRLWSADDDVARLVGPTGARWLILPKTACGLGERPPNRSEGVWPPLCTAVCTAMCRICSDLPGELPTDPALQASPGRVACFLSPPWPLPPLARSVPLRLPPGPPFHTR